MYYIGLKYQIWNRDGTILYWALASRKMVGEVSRFVAGVQHEDHVDNNRQR